MDNILENFKVGVWGNKAPKNKMWNKWVHRNLSDNHCSECLMLDGCWFEKEKTPKHPHHLFCHCALDNLPYSDVLNNATAQSAYSKYDPYLFDTNGEYGHGKDELFKSLGFSVEDSEYLKSEIEKQGLEKYISGEYILGKLNDKGQRISITIGIERKDKNGVATFESGWMVYPNGNIKLTTPYGGK